MHSNHNLLHKMFCWDTCTLYWMRVEGNKYQYHIISSNAALPFCNIYPRFCSDINLMRLLTSTTNRPHSGFLNSIFICKTLISFLIFFVANKNGDHCKETEIDFLLCPLNIQVNFKFNVVQDTCQYISGLKYTIKILSPFKLF